MGMRFKDYLLEQRESFFEEKYPSKEDRESEQRLSDEENSSQKTDSQE